MVLLDNFPVWAVYVALIITLMVVAEIGFRMGLRIQENSENRGESKMTGAVVGGMLGLMAFLMAFTIGIVLNQQGERRAVVVDEANAIGTAWLRAGFLDEPDMTSARGLLQEYTEIRLDAAADPTKIGPTIVRSEEIHNELWRIMEESVARGNDSDIMGLMIESVNDVIDIHALRLSKVNLRLPRILGILLFIATILSFMLIGVASSTDGKRDTAAMLLFAVVFSAVLIVIVDLDRPQEGMLTVSQTAMSDLLRQITPPGQ
jgi:hypothetical protein